MSRLTPVYSLVILSSLSLAACFDTKTDDTGTATGTTTDGGTTSSTDGGTTSTDGGATITDGGATITDGGTTITDGGTTTTDGGTTDGGTTSSFTPTMILFEASTGIVRGAQADVTDGGTSLGHEMTILLINDDWSGLKDTANYCSITFDTDGAAGDNTCADCWRGLAWSVDDTTPYTTDGECSALDPADWTDDVGSYMAGMTHGYGFGPSSSDFLTELESTYGSYWADYGDKFISTYFRTDLTGGTDWYELDYGLVYEVDSTGSIVTDSTGAAALLDAGLETAAPDGYYTSGFYYGFSL